jgi:hypothetical protein
MQNVGEFVMVGTFARHGHNVLLAAMAFSTIALMLKTI